MTITPAICDRITTCPRCLDKACGLPEILDAVIHEGDAVAVIEHGGRTDICCLDCFAALQTECERP